MFSGAMTGTWHQHRGKRWQVFATVYSQAESRERPAGDEHLFPDFHGCRGAWSGCCRVHHVAGLRGRLGAGVHRHAHVSLREGRGSFVPCRSFRDEMALACFRGYGRAFARAWPAP